MLLFPFIIKLQGGKREIGLFYNAFKDTNLKLLSLSKTSKIYVCVFRDKKTIEAERNITLVCFEEGVSYEYGEYVDYDVSENPLGCQKHCQAHPDCTHFTYYHETNRCYRKTGNSKTDVSGAISGPRNCTDLNYVASPEVSTTPGTCDAPDALCLVGGVLSSEGTLTLGGKYICDDEWDLVDANVACKQLGYVGALRQMTESYFGQGRPGLKFAMDNVDCQGTEERLIDCDHETSDDCGISELAGVICDPQRREDNAKVDSSSCFQTNVSYSPGEWVDFTVQASAHDCQIYCESLAECAYFTFYLDSHNCYRKSQSAKPSPRVGTISGPRTCPSVANATGANATTTTTSPLPRNCALAGVVCLEGGRNQDSPVTTEKSYLRRTCR